MCTVNFPSFPLSRFFKTGKKHVQQFLKWNGIFTAMLKRKDSSVHSIDCGSIEATFDSCREHLAYFCPCKSWIHLILVLMSRLFLNLENRSTFSFESFSCQSCLYANITSFLVKSGVKVKLCVCFISANSNSWRVLVL